MNFTAIVALIIEAYTQGYEDGLSDKEALSDFDIDVLLKFEDEEVD